MAKRKTQFMTRFLTLVAAFILAFSWNAFGQDNNPKDPKGGSERDAQNANARNAASVTAPNNAQHSKSDAADNRENSRYKLEQRQTRAEELMAKWTKKGSVAAIVGIFFLILALVATMVQNYKLGETNRIMREQHEAEQRPWLSVNIFTKERFKNIPVDNEPGYLWIARCETKNHGSSPALNVAFIAKLEAFNLKDPITGHIGAARRLGEELKEKGKTPSDAVFPEEKRVFSCPVSISHRAILETASYSATEDIPRVSDVVLYGVITVSLRKSNESPSDEIQLSGRQAYHRRGKKHGRGIGWNEYFVLLSG